MVAVHPKVGSQLRLTEIADDLVSFDDGTKGRGYYTVYDRYFADLSRAATLIELGVYQGQSTKVFSRYFDRGRIIAIDATDRGLDFSGYPNVIFEQADQRDDSRLAAICARHAPNGVDIVIDDAAHIGSWSRASYQALLPLLNPGGLYIVEDWGTGYWSDWPDGGAVRQPFWRWGRRLRSHDHGMVGFVKSLIDDVSTDIRPTRGAPASRGAVLEFVHTYNGFVVARKLP